MSESKNANLKLIEDLEALKNQKEKIASDLLDAESLNKKLKKENLLLKNATGLILDSSSDERSSFNNRQIKDDNKENDIESANCDYNQREINVLIKINENEDNNQQFLTNNFSSENKQEEINNVINNKLHKLANLFIQTPKVIIFIKIILMNKT